MGAIACFRDAVCMFICDCKVGQRYSSRKRRNIFMKTYCSLIDGQKDTIADYLYSSIATVLSAVIKTKNNYFTGALLPYDKILLHFLHPGTGLCFFGCANGYAFFAYYVRKRAVQ